jgi:nucleoside-diphosphate-sugar epimerase
LKIAVTGATGGLGRSLVEFLLQKNVEVAALGRNREVGVELTKIGAHFFQGEIGDTTVLKSAFSGCEIVVHCAGLASPWGKWESFYNSNVVGTAAVLDTMRDLNITKLVYISTPSVYFSGRPTINAKESDPLPEPQTFYSRSKLMADELVLEAVKSWRLNAVLLRPRAIFGPYDNAILPRILRVMKKGIMPLADGGTALVDLTAVENVVHAIWLCINSKESFDGEIFNITNAEPMSVRDLTHKVAEILHLKVVFISFPMALLLLMARLSELYAKLFTGREPALSMYAIQSLGITQTLNIENAKKRLGYAPIISLEKAISNFAERQKT